MLDLAATSLALRASKRNTLKNNVFQKFHGSFLFGMAVIALAGGWYAAHHIVPAGAAQVAAASPAVTVNAMMARPQNVRIWSEFSGKLDAVNYAEVRTSA